ncbi:MAG: hypothetical protein ABI843_15345 [Dokdonella sp.]
MRVFLQRFVSLMLLLSAIAAQAQSAVPAALEPWRGWVLQGQEYRICPLIAGKPGNAQGDFLCAWPGVLSLSAEAGGAAVVQHWRVDADSWVPLPGDAEHWPQQVMLDGQPVAVVDHSGPMVRLVVGSHELRARIPWRERPQTLRVPQTLGLVALNIDGKPIVPAQRDGDELSLGRASIETPEADSIELRVFRRLTDGVPAELTSVIEVYASGQAREEIIGPALPEGFAPLSLVGEWPARLDADGRLRIRVQPGNATLTLEARASAPLTQATARLPAAPWPQQEIWSYAAAPRLRVTSASSALQVDPRQSNVPSDWKALPAFALADGATLTIEERSRGLAADDRNRLSLDREMWLDFDGGGWFARDHVQGEMLQGWRFDAATPFALERADAVGIAYRDNNEPLLVTRGATPALSGVEWRTPAVDLAAGLRIERAGATLPIAGWQDSFDRVDTILHLPNGYRLLGAPGSDRALGSWISAWTLLDVFVAAVLTLLAWRLFGAIGGVATAAYLVLGYQETGSPLWSLLAVIALALIVRALPIGRLATAVEWLKRAALLLFVVVALPFVADQLRYALHPQLENEGGFALGGFGAARDNEFGAVSQPQGQVESAVPAAAPPPALASPAPASQAEASVLDDKGGSFKHRAARAAKKTDAPNDQLETITVTGSNIRRLDLIDHYSESTVVQTGAGEPGWNLGRRYALSWSGPVLPTQEVHLLIAPPWLVRPLRIVLVALLAWLLARLLLPALRMRIPRTAAGLLMATLGAVSLGAARPAQAQAFPPDSLLSELRTHLTEAAKCAPSCATIAKAAVSAHADEIRVVLEAHAAERIALPLPFDEKTLGLRSLTIDGVATDAVARHGQALWIALPRGVHRVELVFASSADKIALAFPLRPMRAEFIGDGWESSGIADDRPLTETLTLVRARASTDTPAANTAQQFAPFVHVERSVDLGLDWHVRTSVQRLAPNEGGFAVAIPLLAGEHVSTAGLKVENARVTVAIANGAQQADWQSTLDKGETLSLTAPALSDHAEVWRVLVSPTWHVEFSGVPGVSMQSPEEAHDYRNFEFHPLPGEKLNLKITRPAAVQGATRAIDGVRLTHAVGQRATDSTLILNLRASQGGEQAITLPAAAEVLGVSRDGTTLNLRPQDGKLSLPVVPGTQSFEIRLRENAAAAFSTGTPAITLGLPAANIALALELPQDRWLLATGGPASGPAVLYWSELAVMLLIAFALARTRRTPLKLWQWILLGLGFSMFSWIALLVVAAWLFALDWRARITLTSARAFNAVQLGLAALTVVALICLLASVQQGLLGTPDMHVAGNGSNAHALRWFADRSTDTLPVAHALSVPLWIYKLAMLAWALWLANALVGWLRGGFAAWTRDGYWRSVPRPVVDVPKAQAPPAPAAPTAP